jgi:hypothetical protein
MLVALLQLPTLAATCPPENCMLTSMHLACSVMHKHAMELRKMADAEHMHLVPLIEAALAIMRLSCEKVGCFPSAVNVVQDTFGMYDLGLWSCVELSDMVCPAVLRAGLGVCGVSAVPGAAAHGAPRHPAERAPVGHVPKGGAVQQKDTLL